MTDHVEIRSGSYYDSVSLMQVSRAVAAAEGVTAAQVAMATELNLDVIAGMGFTVPDAGPNDLVVAIRAASEAGITSGLGAVESALTGLHAASGASGGFGQAPAPHTLGGAVRRGAATLAMVSVPGRYATAEALDAIACGASVMLFSDNVPVEDEVLLKDAATAADVLVMGPDCGTAVVGGVALGFANAVRAGSVGLVAASGTGAQQVMCLLDAAGVGMSHCLGLGGRDLSAAVGGRSARQALAAFAADPATEWVVVVSKPPAPEVLASLKAYAGGLGLRVHWATLGAGQPDLTAAVEAALEAEGHPVPEWPAWGPGEPARASIAQSSEDRSSHGPGHPPNTDDRGGWLRGLFCGGTLADEAMLIAGKTLGQIRSNTPLSPELALGPDLASDGHTVIDFGDDGMTQGRPHPMIDPSLRLERICAESRDPGCGVLLLDLVLGYGSHPDPAGELAEAITGAKAAAGDRGADLPVVVSLTGVEADPQGLTRCAETLRAAGAAVFLSNAQATRHAVALLAGEEGWS
jgi:FdrA protein